MLLGASIVPLPVLLGDLPFFVFVLAQVDGWDSIALFNLYG